MHRVFTVECSATDDADWAETVEFINDDTNAEIDVSTWEFRLQITDCGSSLVTIGTEVGNDVTMTRPATNQIAWRVPKSIMSGLDTKKTYSLGMVSVNGTDIDQRLVGTLAIIDGGMA